jgi:hypothetical protein
MFSLLLIIFVFNLNLNGSAIIDYTINLVILEKKSLDHARLVELKSNHTYFICICGC